MENKIIFATGNEGKMREVREILSDLGMEILSMKEAGVFLDIVEDGTSFEENARIKARAVQKATGALVLADDSGLAVDFLNGAPGVYSARYMGEDTPYSVKNQAIIDQLREAGGKERSARFCCAIAAVFPDGSEVVTEGVIEGVIADAPRGDGGFGYDPIFYLPERGMTTAELSAEEKNAVSHRGSALQKMKPWIKEWMGRQKA